MSDTKCAQPAPRSLATDGVITVERLRANGFSAAAIATRCRPGGPWRRLLPRVILLGGEPTRRQLALAALAQSGPGAVLTGADALLAQGVEIDPPRGVQVLVPVERRMMPRDFVVLERTTRLPHPIWADGLRCAPPVRAVADAARREHDPERLRRLLGVPVEAGLCSVAEILRELDAGNQRGSAAVRHALRTPASKRGSIAHQLARELMRQVPLPPPRWHVPIGDRRGRPVGVADAWWDEPAVAWQFEEPRAVSAGTLVQLALTAAGVTVVRAGAEQIRAEPRRVLRELVSAFGTAARRRRPDVRTLGLDAVPR